MTKEDTPHENDVKDFVSVFSTMWKEIDRQIPGLTGEVKLRVFETIAGAFTEAMGMAADNDSWEDDEDLDDRR